MPEETASKTTYYKVFGILMALLLVTIGASYIEMGIFNVYLALSIAFIKMILVIMYFMHVKYNPRITWVFVGAGFFWMFIMIVFTLSDFFARY